MYASPIRASQTWRGVTITEFERKQLDALRDELNSQFEQRNETRFNPHPAHEIEVAPKNWTMGEVTAVLFAAIILPLTKESAEHEKTLVPVGPFREVKWCAFAVLSSIRRSRDWRRLLRRERLVRMASPLTDNEISS